jgi:hypothetical protein
MACLSASRQVVWQSDPARRLRSSIRFDPSLREWPARAGRPAATAGEHTSMRWQGYMNRGSAAGAPLEITAAVQLGTAASGTSS